MRRTVIPRARRFRAARIAALAVGATLLAVSPVHAQDAGQPGADADGDVAEIVVTARLAGAPIWEVSAGTGTVLLVGEISDVPKATPWRPERLEAATGRADRVILGTKAKISPGDIFRLLFRGSRLQKLPPGQTTASYLSVAQQRQLAEIGASTGKDYTRQSMLMTGFQLLADELRFNKDTTDTATDVVRRAARRARVATQPVSVVRGEDLLDNLFTADPSSHVPCLEAAMTAYEQREDVVLQRGRDWTGLRVAAVMRSPLEQALGSCWPWTDGAFGPALRQQWDEAVRGALASGGVTLAVVPLRILAERGGLLDDLAANRTAIKGPAWRDAS